MDKLNIVMATSEYRSLDGSGQCEGGLGVMVGDFARELVKQGHAVRVVVPDFYGEKKDQGVAVETISTHRGFENDHFRAYSKNSSWLLQDEVRSIEIFRQELEKRILDDKTIDIVHLHDWHFGTLARNIAEKRKEGKPKVISTIHNAEYQGIAPLYDTLLPSTNGSTQWSDVQALLHEGMFSYMKLLFQHSDALVTVSHQYASVVRNLKYPHATTVQAIPNGLDITPFQLDAAPPPTFSFFSSKKPRLLIASRLVPEKGIEAVLLALPELAEKYEIDIAGTCYDPYFSALLKQMDVKGKLHYHGKLSRKETLKEMERADVFLSASVNEPFGIAPLEAMFLGAVPLVSASGGHSDNFTDLSGNRVYDATAYFMHKVGVMTNPGYQRREALSLFANDIVSTATTVHEMLTSKNSALGTLLVANGRRQALDGRWSIEKCAQQYVALYQKTLAS